MILHETKQAAQGKPAKIIVKLNSLSSQEMIDQLYSASQAGVKIEMIIRGICCLVPGVKGMSENIEVISIVDKFLEHTRLYVFGNNNNPKIYISSADWMTRNIENRVEVSCPIYDENIKKELLDTFEISWSDNVKARNLNETQNNESRKNNKDEIRSQLAIHDDNAKKLKN